MEFEDNIKLFLPQYLSEDGLNTLKKQLRAFADGHDSGEYFTTRLKNEHYLLQGDGVRTLYFNFPDTSTREVPALLLSNTCDMDFHNIRLNPCRIMYAPILNLKKYEDSLLKNGIAKERVDGHIQDIRNQQISQILYLPTETSLGYDGIVMFDRAISVPLSERAVNGLVDSRLFTLSNYGFYLLLLKLSYHFTRIQEKVDRLA